VIFRHRSEPVVIEEKTAVGGSLPAGFRAFQSRVSPIPAFAIRATTSCSRCGEPLDTVVFLASSRRLEPETIVEAASAICPQCKIATQEASP
jgi:hypothetical protein